VCTYRKIEVNPRPPFGMSVCYSMSMNEDIAKALLTLEAGLTQAEQRVADLEFQLRQVHRDLARVQQGICNNSQGIDYLTGKYTELLRRTWRNSWAGRTK
jgi:hypothetical protein